jgi:putative tRNA adenosine deaminase-associated protein
LPADFSYRRPADYGDGMAAQRARDNSAPSDQFEDLDGFGVAVVLDDGKWKCAALTSAALNSLEAAETELREMRSSGAVFGLLDIDDEFFVILRPAPSGTRLLLSDATAALDYDIASDVLDALNIETPDLDPDELDDVDPWEEGDLSLLADLGLPEPVLGVILAETELYPDEQLGMIAQRLGFATELGSVLDTLPR